jgi:hypothetical protein
VRKAENLPLSSADVTESGSLNLPEPSGPHRAVMGLLYLLSCTLYHIITYISYSIINQIKYHIYRIVYRYYHVLCYVIIIINMMKTSENSANKFNKHHLQLQRLQDELPIDNINPLAPELFLNFCTPCI